MCYSILSIHKYLYSYIRIKSVVNSLKTHVTKIGRSVVRKFVNNLMFHSEKSNGTFRFQNYNVYKPQPNTHIPTASPQNYKLQKAFQ